ncbi:MAG: hypothetical protein M1824_005449 [Vezdaea acicularis]|nr:MAG: hypothetical protein M1824_005449 [Vezdaea acicularis]
MTEKSKTSSMDSTFPVLVPQDDRLFASDEQFKNVFYKDLEELRLGSSNNGSLANIRQLYWKNPEKLDLVKLMSKLRSEDAGESDLVHEDFETGLDSKKSPPAKSSGSAFIDALHAPAPPKSPLPDDKMLTENGAIAWKSTNSGLLDLFTELEKTVAGPRLTRLLFEAWADNPIATLRIIFNARSIHIGKAERDIFYRAVGWLKWTHPATLLANLPELTRKSINKKAENEDTVMVEADIEGEKESTEEKVSADVKFGVSHGYWKDLLNILVLEVNDHLDVLGSPRTVLNIKNDQPKSIEGKRDSVKRGSTKHKSLPDKKARESSEEPQKANDQLAAEQKAKAKERKHDEEALRHANFLNAYKNNIFYRVLHLTVARSFANQLQQDLELLKTQKAKNIDLISLAAKWAPSLEGFHDKHTFIASTIAELLYAPVEPSDPHSDEHARTAYLKTAREYYRAKYLSPLRKALQVVERDVSANEFAKITYSRVPSIAMNNYKDLFAAKDFERFSVFIEEVTSGKSHISGAVLQPGQMVAQIRDTNLAGARHARKVKASELIKAKRDKLLDKVLTAQWNTLVQRIKDNGKLENSIAVCDVSGSMCSPVFPDKTCPMDSSIGLSLLLAEVCQPPFGGTMISFSAKPVVHKIETDGSFSSKVKSVIHQAVGFNTNFVAVFLDCILPRAVEHKLTQEQMVKQVFVFSDMQFDEAQSGYGASVDKWETSYQTIEKAYKKHGYKVPRLIFWNLAGGRAEWEAVLSEGASVAPKPVQKDTPNTALVSGYSQGMLKVFLDGGDFGSAEEEEEEVTVETGKSEEGDDDDMEVITKKTKADDPEAVMKKALDHPSYVGLKVVD